MVYHNCEVEYTNDVIVFLSEWIKCGRIIKVTCYFRVSYTVWQVLYNVVIFRSMSQFIKTISCPYLVIMSPPMNGNKIMPLLFPVALIVRCWYCSSSGTKRDFVPFPSPLPTPPRCSYFSPCSLYVFPPLWHQNSIVVLPPPTQFYYFPYSPSSIKPVAWRPSYY